MTFRAKPYTLNHVSHASQSVFTSDPKFYEPYQLPPNPKPFFAQRLQYSLIKEYTLNLRGTQPPQQVKNTFLQVVDPQALPSSGQGFLGFL